MKRIQNRSPNKPLDEREGIDSYWSLSQENLFDKLRTSFNGLTSSDARARLTDYGLNVVKVREKATLYFLFMAAGHHVSPCILLAGYGLPLLLGKVSFLPGGVGIVEGTMTALYTSLGVPIGVTVVVILSYRVLSFWLPTLIGFPMVPYLHRVCNRQ